VTVFLRIQTTHLKLGYFKYNNQIARQEHFSVLKTTEIGITLWKQVFDSPDPNDPEHLLQSSVPSLA
jgi:hypothetical protein